MHARCREEGRLCPLARTYDSFAGFPSPFDPARHRDGAASHGFARPDLVASPRRLLVRSAQLVDLRRVLPEFQPHLSRHLPGSPDCRPRRRLRLAADGEPRPRTLLDPGNTPPAPESGATTLPHKAPVLSTNVSTDDIAGNIGGQSWYEDYTFFYGRRWTYLGGLSPFDFTVALLPRRRIQPILRVAAGFAVSPRDIPMFDSSAFNFTFSAGAGLRLWRTPTHATLL